MATLALAAAGAAAGGALLPAGLSVLGATISGATIGAQIGALAGNYVDQALFAASGGARRVAGPRLADLRITSSTEGAAIPRLAGRARLGAQVIWATDLEEEASTTSATGSGKGAPRSSSTESGAAYRYYADFAVALCEGPISSVGRIWADGRELDLDAYVWRLHKGTETQEPDSLIVAREGLESTPAYRGIAYVVFERMPLAAFGNRIPQLSFEVFRAVDEFQSNVRAVVLIPGSGEFVYATQAVSRRVGAVRTEPENSHTAAGATDWEVALAQLADTLPNVRSVSLVVSWFGSDLRAGHCELRPAVDAAEKDTSPIVWSVAGLDRASSPVVSSSGGKAAYGGTPSDSTVVQAIRDLKARGYGVVLTPFILMDVPAECTLPDPYRPGAFQPAYPWRGRITVDPAPGVAGTPDRTAAAAAQLSHVVGSCAVGDFSVSGESVVYAGPAEWTLRRMILHYAHLAVAAGGVDAIVVGTELKGLTQVRSATAAYPFVDALVELAVDVKSVVGAATKVTYAADWSEYFGHRPEDGSGDVLFHLDPLWSSPAIDAVAIDCYWPLADWRDGAHLDREAGARSVYDLGYLAGNIFGGEGYDWFYATGADRAAQIRTPITDAAEGKAFVFRYKDIRSWWSSLHYDRPSGVEVSTPTAWVPASKPVWLTEIGCPAIDKGANQPNVFVDAKSSESFIPYFSSGARDDLMQRRYLQAMVEAFDPDSPGYVEGANPVSEIYGGPMLDLDHVHVYAWDARPYPAFPSNDLVWSDGESWRRGHWLNGRIASQPLDRVIGDILDGYDFPHYDVEGLEGLVAGLVLDRPMSAREALQPLELAHFLDAVESGGAIRFRHRADGPVRLALSLDDLVETRAGAELVRLTRAQETDLPAAARISYASLEDDYRHGVAQSRRLVGASGRLAEAQVALVMEAAEAQATAEIWLFEAWAARERASFTLPPSAIAIEPGDLVSLSHAGVSRLFRITEVGEQTARQMTALSVDPSVYTASSAVVRRQKIVGPAVTGPVLGIFLDLPLLTGAHAPEAGYVVASRVPWQGGAAFYRSPDDQGFELAARARHRATTGTTLDDLPPGPASRFDRAARLRVRLDAGTLISTEPSSLLAGANAAAVRSSSGEWEVLQFATATLVGPGIYELSTLLRGQAGSEAAMATTIPAGATFVLLDSAVTEVPLTRDEIGLPFNWRYGPATLDIGHLSFQSTSHAFRGVGLRPLSPVHIRGRRTAAGDLVVTWTRRTRIGGDSWASVEVPLGEEVEAYEVDILSGTSIVRTLVSGTTTVSYSAAEQSADFGAPQASVMVSIAQTSPAFGRGTSRAAVI